MQTVDKHTISTGHTERLTAGREDDWPLSRRHERLDGS